VYRANSKVGDVFNVDRPPRCCSIPSRPLPMASTTASVLHIRCLMLAMTQGTGSGKTNFLRHEHRDSEYHAVRGTKDGITEISINESD
jgi:hypothetical protein